MSEYLRLGEAILHGTSPDFLDTKPNPKTNPDPYATIMIKIRLYLDLRFWPPCWCTTVVHQHGAFVLIEQILDNFSFPII